MTEVRRIPSAASQGDRYESEQLLPLVYDELRKLAAVKMAREKPGQTLQATALVHEAYVRLISGDTAPRWDSRSHFFAAAAEAMRRILIENARRKRRAKHGGQLQRVGMDAVDLPIPLPDDELIELDGALDRLAAVDSCAAEVVKLCFFVGLTQEQAAKEIGVSTSTAERLWAFARAWLFRAVQESRGTTPREHP